MTEETNKLGNLNEDTPTSKKKFLTILSFAILVLLLSISIIGYYLFLSSKTNTNQYLTTEVEFLNKDTSIDLNPILKKKDFEIKIYLSIPGKELVFLGEGILISSNKVVTGKDVLKEYKKENIIIKNDENTSESLSIETSPFDYKLVTLGTNLKGYKEFSEADIKIGDKLYIKNLRTEQKNNNSLPEEIVVINSLNILGKFEDSTKYLTDLDYTTDGKGIYNQKGELVGLISNSDSRKKSVFVAGKVINKFVKNSLNIEESNQEKLGIKFEFSELSRFRKEGRPVGLVVKDLRNGSKADVAGIKKEDIVLTINNQVLVSQDDLDKLFNNLNEKEELRFEIIREDKKIGITLSLE